MTGGNLLNGGAGGCFPFFDSPSTLNNICPIVINELLKMLERTNSIKTVILSGRAVTDLNEDMLIPKNSDYNNENNPYIIFQNGMIKTLQYIVKINKQIVFVLDTPDLEFNPIVCLKRPWRFDESALKELCAVPRSQVNLRRKKYLEIVMPILHDFPSVEVLDTVPAFCDDNYCWAVKDKKLLYRDHDHLSETGSIYLGQYFLKAKDNQR